MKVHLGDAATASVVCRAPASTTQPFSWKPEEVTCTRCLGAYRAKTEGKVCPWCNKTHRDFLSHPELKGRRCWDCYRAYQADWRMKRRAQGLRASGRYDLEQQREYRRRPETRRIINKRKKQYLQDPVERFKENARNKLRRAIQSGIVKKEPCEECGTTTGVHGHHDSYERPLDVRWLCAIHHDALHRRMRKSLAEKES